SAHSQLPSSAPAPAARVAASIASPFWMIKDRLPLSIPMLIISAVRRGTISPPATSRSIASMVSPHNRRYGFKKRNTSFISDPPAISSHVFQIYLHIFGKDGQILFSPPVPDP